MLFSQRNGLVPEKTIQRESLDMETRNQLWDILYCYFDTYRWDCTVVTSICTEFFKMSRDQIPTDFPTYCREYFLKGEWYNCYNFMEFVLEKEILWGKLRQNKPVFLSDDLDFFEAPLASRKINKVLEQESCAYRVIKGRFTKITSETEMAEVAAALECKSHPVSEHIEKALGFLTNRTNPDYANSAKESIMAVESLCCTVANKPKATLRDALSICRKTTKLHPALLDAFDKLYGYACNEEGIRHSGIKFTDVDQPLAQFMLVTCSTFINYVKVTQKLDL